MGSNPTKSSFEQMNWRFVQQNNHQTILFNDLTSKSIEKHEVTMSRQFQYINEVCEWRSHLPPSSHIVQLLQYGIKEGGLCNGQSQLYAITERIHLFSQLASITQPQSFLLLKHIITGLQTLFQKFGIFSPYPKLFGINSQGIGKVWINQNFAQCQPQQSRIPVQQSQLGIVNSLVRIISQKVYCQGHQQLVSYPFNLNFKETIRYINNAISKVKGFQINKVYRDRQEYQRDHFSLKQKHERQAKSHLFLLEAQKKLVQIQALKAMLKQQQLQLAQKQNNLKIQSNNRPSHQPLQPQPIQQTQQINNQHFHPTPEMINPNSQKRILKNTASTNNSAENYPIMVNSPPPQIQQNHQISRQINLFPQQNHRLPPLPPQKQSMKKYEEQQKMAKYSLESNSNGKGHQSLKKQIEMVDSMLLIQDDEVSDKNKMYVESRVIGNPRSRQNYQIQHRL